MSKTWLHNLCEPLLHPQYEQIKGALIKYNKEFGQKKSEIIGKCAEGEIACQNGIVVGKFQNLLDSFQLKKLGIPKDLVEEGMPMLRRDGKDGHIEFNMDNQIDDIGDYIIYLNDAGFTYPEIVEFLITTFEDTIE